MPTNVTVDIYAGSDPANTNPAGNPRTAGVKGYLKPTVQTGRHGTASWLRWTHVLYINTGVQVQDAYNSQNDPARNNNLGDTVVLANDLAAPGQGARTPFFVVFVEVVNRSLPSEHQRVYLDRFKPTA
jgi:hypothetical protein